MIALNVIREEAARLKVEPEALLAVLEVETNGNAFINGPEKGMPLLPKILFEGHIFYQRLKKKGYDVDELARKHPTIVYANWTNKYYKGGYEEYRRLKEAMKIDYSIAQESASWGLPQIMGFNYGLCGYDNVEDYVASNHEPAEVHFKNFVTYLKNRNLVQYLKEKNWAGFARRYNGPGYKKNKYDLKMANAYVHHKHNNTF